MNKNKISSFIPAFLFPAFLLCLTHAVSASAVSIPDVPVDNFPSKYDGRIPLSAFVISTHIAKQSASSSLLGVRAPELEKEREEGKSDGQEGDEQEGLFESDAEWVDKDAFGELVHYQERFGRMAFYISESDPYFSFRAGFGANVASIYQNPWLDTIRPDLLQMTTVFHHLKPHFFSPWLPEKFSPSQTPDCSLLGLRKQLTEGKRETKYDWQSYAILGSPKEGKPEPLIGSGIFRYSPALDIVVITFPSHNYRRGKESYFEWFMDSGIAQHVYIQMSAKLGREKFFLPFRKPLSDLMDRFRDKITSNTKWVLLEEALGCSVLFLLRDWGGRLRDSTGMCTAAAEFILPKLKEFYGDKFDNTKENKLIYVITGANAQVHVSTDLSKIVGLHNIAFLPFNGLEGDFQWSWDLDHLATVTVPVSSVEKQEKEGKKRAEAFLEKAPRKVVRRNSAPS